MSVLKFGQDGNPTVYLSVGNFCSKDLVQKTLNYLQHFNVQVLQHDGGCYYDESAVENADYFLLLPQYLGATMIEVGKGQYSELGRFHYNNAKDEDEFPHSYVISDLSTGICVDEVLARSPVGSGSNWKTNYGIIDTDGCQAELSNYGRGQQLRPKDSYYRNIDKSLGRKPKGFNLALAGKGVYNSLMGI